VLNGAKISTKVRQKLIRESMLTPFWNRMVDEAVIVGAVDIDARLYRDNLHTFRRHEWSAPRWSYAINPAEEVKATVMALDNNLTTLARVHAEEQLDTEEVLPQRAMERQMERDGNILPNAVAAAETAAEMAEASARQAEQTEQVAA
jgi:capsid protein